MLRWSRLWCALAALVLAVTLSPSSVASEAARGIVYHDVNANGRRDADEPGVANVRISDGVRIVQSDADGRYELSLQGEGSIFVIKPRGWMTQLDQRNLPRFYYIHRPRGTPDERFLFKGVGPTGPLPSSIDFPLYPQAEGDAFDVLLVGDPQPYHTQELTYYARDLAPEFRRVKVAFAIALGDLVGDNLNLFEPYNQVNALAGFPFYNVIGNHDLNYMAPTDNHSDATFERVFGPSTYAFQHGKAHFIILNNVYWKGFRGYRRDGWPQRGNYEGRIRDDQLAFIGNYLKGIPQDEFVAVFSHIPMSNGVDTQPHATPEFPELLELLSTHPNTASFSGHTHINFNVIADSDFGYRPANGAVHVHHNVGTASGSWYAGPLDDEGTPGAMMRDGTPRGYGVLRIKGNRYAYHFQLLGRPADEQMRIHAPDVVVAGSPVNVHANVFNGSSRSVTRIRIAGQTSWQTMQQMRTTDPHYAALHARVKENLPESDRALPEPVETDHHWVTTLAGSLKPGVYTIEVETTDLFGQTFTGTRPLRIVASEEAWRQLDEHNIRVPRERPAAAATP